MIYVGPAGWSYKDWYGKVYPSPKPKGFNELAYIANYFDTVEVNSSFYAPIRASQTSRWIERTAHNPRFLFTATSSSADSPTRATQTGPAPKSRTCANP